MNKRFAYTTKRLAYSFERDLGYGFKVIFDNKNYARTKYVCQLSYGDTYIHLYSVQDLLLFKNCLINFTKKLLTKGKTYQIAEDILTVEIDSSHNSKYLLCTIFSNDWDDNNKLIRQQVHLDYLACNVIANNIQYVLQSEKETFNKLQ